MALQARGITGLARSTTVAAAVVAMGFGVAGCTGPGESSDGRTRSVSADGTSTPGASTPAGGASDGGGDSPTEEGGASAGIPEENKDLKPPVFDDYPGITENTDEGAEQTLKYFFDAMYYGYATGDTGPMESVTDLTQCKNCATIKSAIVRDAKAGIYLVSGTIEVTLLRSIGQSESGETKVYIEFVRSESIQIANGEASEIYPEKTVKGGGFLVWDEIGKWVLNDVAWEQQD